MRTMLLLLFGAHSKTKIGEYLALVDELRNACDRTGIQLMPTRDPTKALFVLNEPELEIVHLVNESAIGYREYASVCELFAKEIATLAVQPLVNIEHPKLRFLGAPFRRRQILVTETDLVSAVRQRWQYLRTMTPMGSSFP